ncbi:MAG: hypothetical protein A2Y91_01175 [Chloroflexi bacterium RBG_13_54_8]|nr:MAG: hypothetical protein A2Y91_01175 [Chloroflexi bacterium RBG_13_54_8]
MLKVIKDHLLFGYGAIVGAIVACLWPIAELAAKTTLKCHQPMGGCDVAEFAESALPFLR